MSRLESGRWLNDEIINVYCLYIINEIQINNQKIGVYSTSFFEQFYGNKREYDYEVVQAYSLRLGCEDIFVLEKLFIPINVRNTHWILAVIYPSNKKIQIYDSMGGGENHYLEVLRDY